MKGSRSRSAPSRHSQLPPPTISIMGGLYKLKQDLAVLQGDLDTCNEMLQIDPESADALEFIPTLKAQIADKESQIAALQAEKEAAAPPPPPPTSEKFDMSKHPKFLKPSPEIPPPPPPEDSPQTTFNVKDAILAKWSEDKQWYPATIVSKTGSASDPVYKITFTGYGNTETKRKHQIRAVVEPSSSSSSTKKRKADGTPAIEPPSPQQQQQTPASPPAAAPEKPRPTGPTITAAPAVDISLKAPQKREPSKVSDGPTRLAPEPKKLKGSKKLEQGKSNWQAWQANGPKKTGAGMGGAMKQLGRESQFRTPDLPGARVGFTGSGKGMQKDQVRQKWDYGAARKSGWSEEE